MLEESVSKSFTSNVTLRTSLASVIGDTKVTVNAPSVVYLEVSASANWADGEDKKKRDDVRESLTTTDVDESDSNKALEDSDVKALTVKDTSVQAFISMSLRRKPEK